MSLFLLTRLKLNEKTTKESNENPPPPKIKPFTVVRGGDDYINWLKKLISEHWNS